MSKVPSEWTKSKTTHSLKRLIYDQALTLDSLEIRQPRTKYHFAASEAGECKRKIALMCLNTEREKMPTNTEKQRDEAGRVAMLLRDGRYHQDSITTMLQQAPGVHMVNIERLGVLHVRKVWKGAKLHIIITGHPDIIARYDDAESDVVEVKGINRFSTQKLVDENVETLKECYPKAIPQGRIYRRMYKTTGFKVIVKTKDTSQVNEFTFKKSKELEDKVIERFLDVAYDLKRGVLPDCDYLKKDRRCFGCPFTKQCGQ